MTYLEEGASGVNANGATRSSITQSATRRRQIWLLIPYEGGDISFDNHWQDDWCTILSTSAWTI